MAQLIRYEQARKALSEARSVDEVKDIRDKAEAMSAYARMAKDRDLETWAADIRIRAERRAGKLLAEMDMQKGGRPAQSASSENLTDSETGRSDRPVSDTPTLSELGITKDQSSAWQRLASVPDHTFEAILAGKKQEGKVPSASAVHKQATQGDRPKRDPLEERFNLMMSAMRGFEDDQRAMEPDEFLAVLPDYARSSFKRRVQKTDAWIQRAKELITW